MAYPSKPDDDDRAKPSDPTARAGWESDFPTFQSTPPLRISERLAKFCVNPSPEQIDAWHASIPQIQREVREVLDSTDLARHYSAILEYELPMETRRPDVIVLVGAAVVVMELKGKLTPSQADLDQVAAYARDLECYHRECATRPVIPVLVPTRAHGYVQDFDGIHVVGPDAVDQLVAKIAAEHTGDVVAREAFLAESAYRPLPTLVEAARELFQTGSLRPIHRARAATDPAVDEITRIVHSAALTKSRHLILITGVPGAGKTLVGLRTVHAHYLDDLAVARGGEKPTAPAVFLSGNGPLVDVLQYELKKAGGGGKTFVRRVKDYVAKYSRGSVPPEHVLVFDEAQRAFDPEKMAETHGTKTSLSEPEMFIRFAERVPEWCVVVGLIGTGQEIHVGEEAGVGQWHQAIARSPEKSSWTVHGPESLAPHFTGAEGTYEVKPPLSLDTELRFHAATVLHAFVDGLLTDAPIEQLQAMARQLEESRYHLRITRNLEMAKQYLRDRYADDPDARFGMIASSKDRDLEAFGVPNSFQATKQVRMGPWYSDPEDAYAGRSCRLLETCVTEFGAQGLELDAALLAWGTDLIRLDGRWSNANARGYKRGSRVDDPMQLRINAYRVLLTRGRDGVIVFIPCVAALDETYEFLVIGGLTRTA